MIRTIFTDYGPTEHNLAVRDQIVAQRGYLVTHCKTKYEAGDVLRWRYMELALHVSDNRYHPAFMATRLIGLASPEDLAEQRRIVGDQLPDAPVWPEREDYTLWRAEILSEIPDDPSGRR